MTFVDICKDREKVLLPLLQADLSFGKPLEIPRELIEVDMEFL
jgi:hypothetical protein